MLVPSQRLVAGTVATILVTFTNQDGEPANPTGTVTVALYGGDGRVLLPPGSAVTIPNGASAGQRAITLTPAPARPDLLRAVWSEDAVERATTYHELVGGVYFTEAEARAADPSLQDATYTSAAIRQARAHLEYEFERILGFPMVPRYSRERIRTSTGAWGVQGYSLPLREYYPRQVVALRPATATGVAWTAGELAALSYGDRVIYSATTWGTDDVWVDYIHGWDRPPQDVKDAALLRLRTLLNANRSGIPSRAERYQLAEGGTYVLAMPRSDRTGIPDVDAVLARYRRTRSEELGVA